MYKINNFSKILRKLRIEKGMYQSEIARQLDITEKAISNYERGKREPSFDNLLKLSKILNVSIDCLLGNKQEKKLDNAS